MSESDVNIPQNINYVMEQFSKNRDFCKLLSIYHLYLFADTFSHLFKNSRKTKNGTQSQLTKFLSLFCELDDLPLNLGIFGELVLH